MQKSYFCLLVALICGHPIAVWSQPVPQKGNVDSALESLRVQLEHARFRLVLSTIGSVLEGPRLNARQRNDALEMQAIAQLALRENQAANATLQQLYQRDPGHRINQIDAGPEVQAAFTRYRERDHPSEPVNPRLANIETANNARQPLTKEQLSRSVDAVHEVHLYYRDSGRRFSRLMMDRVSLETARVKVPAVAYTHATLDYYIEALAPSGRTLARLGSADKPLRLRFPAALRKKLLSTHSLRLAALEPTPKSVKKDNRIWNKWWFWSSVAAVATGAVAGYFLLGPPNDAPQSGSLGQGTLH
jgi:hypothetical protein